MGAASKGIIQRGYQHNATVYKAPYAKNPFDSVTDDELSEYRKTVERKAHGDCKKISYKRKINQRKWQILKLFFSDTDTDYSESEALSSLQTSGPPKSSALSPPSQSDSEPQVLRIETKQAPKPSQPEVVLSDGKYQIFFSFFKFLNYLFYVFAWAKLIIL